jgi:SAM-dependent methyltransferase
LFPVGNPYDSFSATEYFCAHDRKAKRESGRDLGRQAAAILGRTGSLLELGCGRGDLLAGARDVGWAVHGVDMTPEFAAVAEPGIEIEVAPAETAKALESQYDVVILAAILEHLYEPRACLERVHRALVPGGIVFLDVPDECSLRLAVGNLYMRLRGRDWAINLSPTFPPFHVVGFCRRSLTRLLSSTGFEVVRLEHHLWPNQLPETGSFQRRIERHAFGTIQRIQRAFGSGDGITCWAMAV